MAGVGGVTSYRAGPGGPSLTRMHGRSAVPDLRLSHGHWHRGPRPRSRFPPPVPGSDSVSESP